MRLSAWENFIEFCCHEICKTYFIVSVCLLVSVCMVDLGAHWWISWNLIFLKNPLRRYKLHSNVTRLTVIYAQTYVHLWNYLAQFFLECEMFQTKVVGKISTHILCWNPFIYLYIYNAILWSNVEKYCRARQATEENIIKLMHFACFITKATNSHSGYVILIAFLLQKCASVLHYTYIACLVLVEFQTCFT